jgi:predicted metal-dependent peptidase
LVAVIDASGSISGRQLSAFMAEVMLLADVVDTEIRLMAHDVAVTLDTAYRAGMPAPSTITGGGGTSFKPVVERLNQGPHPDAVAWLTDGCGEYPPQPVYPVLWVLTKNRRTPPWGWTAEFVE